MADEISDSRLLQDSPWNQSICKKRKKSKKDKKRHKGKSSSPGVTKDGLEKKNKSAFSKDMKEVKEKKKKRHKRDIIGLDEGFLFTQGNSTSSPIQQWRNENTPSFNPILPSKPIPLTQLPVNQISGPKPKKKKKRVIFELPPGNVCKTCSKKASCTASLPKDFSQPFDKDSEMRPCQGQEHEESQSTVDDLNSQDLFITQKKFRALLSNPSSYEHVEDIPSTLTSSLTQWHPVKSHVHHRSEVFSVTKANLEPEQKPRELCYLKQKSFPRQLPSDEPAPQLILRATVEEATQTENFFTPRFCSYLMFKEQIGSTASSELPLNLSLPHRTRTALNQKPHLHVIDFKDEEVPSECLRPSPIKLKEMHVESDGCLSSSVIKIDGDSGPLQTAKFADTTSSEDNHLILHSAMTDLSQVNTVQTRLNESYFFKMKGNGQLARPQSPLMKLTRKKKTKKSH